MKSIFCLIVFLFFIQSKAFSFADLVVTDTYTNQNWVNQTVVEGDTIWAATHGGLIKWLKDGTYLGSYYPHDGLMHNWSTSIAVDNDGNKWITNYYGGISKFDGHNWTTYNLNLSGYSFQSEHIVIDSDNTIYAAVLGGGWRGGVFFYADGIWKRKESFSNDCNIRAMEIDNDGVLWVGTFNDGLHSFDGENWTKHEDVGQNANDIKTDHDNNIWIVNFHDGIYKFDGNEYTFFNIEDYIEFNGIPIRLAADGDIIWIGIEGSGLSGALIKFDVINDTMTLVDNSNFLPGRLRDIYVSESGKVFFSTGDLETEGGISVYYNDEWKTFTTESPFAHNFVLSLYEDQQKNIWAGTFEGGTSMYDGNVWTKYTFLDRVKEITSDNMNNIWFATRNGIWKYDWNEWVNYSVADGLPLRDVFDIEFDEYGNLWFATSGGGGGMYDVVNDDWIVYSTENSNICYDDLRALAIDHEGNIWFGSVGNGYSIYDGESFTNYDTPSNVYSLVLDDFGNIWLSGPEGVHMFDGSDWTNYHPDNSGIHKPSICDIAFDSNGFAWFSSWGRQSHQGQYVTGMGLSIYNGEDWLNFGKINTGIGCQTIYKILHDSNGNFWLGTHAGISKGILKLERYVKVNIEPESSGSTSGHGTYFTEDEVSLKATSNSGYEFVNWTNLEGDVLSDSEEYTFIMPAEDITLTANFEKQEYELNIAIEGEGSETELGAGTHSIEFDEEVTLIADPAEGWEFINWTDEDNDEVSDEAEFVFTMPAEDVILNAVFQEIDVFVEEMIGGKITVFPNPANNHITVESEKIIERIRLIDINGQVLKDREIGNFRYEVNVHDLHTGIYFLQIHTDESIVTKRVQVAR